MHSAGRFATRGRQYRTLASRMTVNAKALRKWIGEIVVILRAILKIGVVSILGEVQLVVRVLVSCGDVVGMVPGFSNNSVNG